MIHIRSRCNWLQGISVYMTGATLDGPVINHCRPTLMNIGNDDTLCVDDNAQAIVPPRFSKKKKKALSIPLTSDYMMVRRKSSMSSSPSTALVMLQMASVNRNVQAWKSRLAS